MQERENILRIFKEARDAVASDDSGKIRDLSNQTNNTAALTQDPDNIAAAVIVYSLGKIIERKDYKNQGGWKEFYKLYLNSIDNIIIALKNGDDAKYQFNVRKIRKAIGNLSGELRNNIEEVFRRASINKASKLYEHGASMERTANLLGVTLYELADYAGNKNSDYVSNNSEVKSRIKLAMDMFQ